MPDKGQGHELRIAVIGAGLVGLATATALRRDGHAVTVFDPRPPGEGCSLGNAGIIAPYGVAPVQSPGIAFEVPGMLLDPLSPLALRWSYLPALVPWLTRFVLASGTARVEAVSKALAAILGRAQADWTVLAETAAAASLLRPGGVMMLFGTARSRRDSEQSLALKRRRGVAIEEIGAAEARRLEPALAPVFESAALVRDASWCVDPLALSGRLAFHFEALGGQIRRVAVDRARPRAEGGATLWAGGGAEDWDAAVLCVGAWSRKLARMLGVDVPLDTERGYHVMLDCAAPLLSRPVTLHEGGFYMTPMTGGLRCAGTVELGGLDAPPDPARTAVIERQARRLLPDAGARLSDWLGFRPSMPDSLPVIGPAPGRRGVWFNFGHGHLGLTMSAVSGRMIADMVAGRDPGIDPAPYSAGRF